MVDAVVEEERVLCLVTQVAEAAVEALSVRMQPTHEAPVQGAVASVRNMRKNQGCVPIYDVWTLIPDKSQQVTVPGQLCRDAGRGDVVGPQVHDQVDDTPGMKSKGSLASMVLVPR